MSASGRSEFSPTLLYIYVSLSLSADTAEPLLLSESLVSFFIPFVSEPLLN